MIKESYFINSQTGRIGRDLGSGVKLPFTNSSSFTNELVVLQNHIKYVINL